MTAEEALEVVKDAVKSLRESGNIIRSGALFAALPTLRAAVEERDAAMCEATSLFRALAPQCELLGTPAGILTQINNWCAGARADLAAAVEERDAMQLAYRHGTPFDPTGVKNGMEITALRDEVLMLRRKLNPSVLEDDSYDALRSELATIQQEMKDRETDDATFDALLSDLRTSLAEAVRLLEWCANVMAGNSRVGGPVCESGMESVDCQKEARAFLAQHSTETT